MIRYAKPFPDEIISSHYGPRALGGGTFHEGLDYRLAIRTPLPAIGDGVVIATSQSKKFGKYIVVKADVGGYYRWHACDSFAAGDGDRVRTGETIAYSGQTGFWSTGPHGHLQCTRTLNPDSYTNPLPLLSHAASAGGLSNPFEEDEMSAKAEAQIEAIYAALWNGGKNTIDGQIQTFNYGVLPIVAHNQTLLAKQAGQIAALQATVAAIKGGTSIDLGAIEAAAEKGSREALEGMTFTAHG